ncbi:MAG: hypothetical protein MSG64_17980 [Pyrinomonadaceae bacterium MAG19_C2-C3]|nr:hypothetical protein [Pyrinomonadaceae bacterium MAG19_C2-C3]
MVKQITRAAGVESASYYLYSTLLGGKAVTKLDTSGTKEEGYVYVNGTRLAKQLPGINGGAGSVYWEHENPMAGKGGESNTAGAYRAVKEVDPLGVDVGFDDPFINFGGGYIEPETPALLGYVRISVKMNVIFGASALPIF